jgi:hypothetical protein
MPSFYKRHSVVPPLDVDSPVNLGILNSGSDELILDVVHYLPHLFCRSVWQVRLMAADDNESVPQISKARTQDFGSGAAPN